MQLRVAQFIPRTEVEGPGVRACIQVQGCPIHCPGCGVPHTWSDKGGISLSIQELAEQIISGPKVEGVTFLGGEPFAQAEALSHLAQTLKGHHLSVLTFTGYTLEELTQANREDYNRLIACTDLLIDGPFKKELLDLKRPWVGSSNQRYHFLTDQYKHLENTLDQIQNKVEVRLSPDGRIMINGLAEIDDLKHLITG